MAIQVKPVIRQALRIAVIAAGGWLAMAFGLYIFQDRLIYFPQAIEPAQLSSIRRDHPDANEMTLTAPDGVSIHGWFVRDTATARTPLIIYFGGNGDEASQMVGEAKRLKGWSLALFNYRGYGLSQGKPTEVGLCSDALMIYDSMVRRKDIDPTRIVIMGRSLGTGVATYLASTRKATAVVLVSPFESITALAKEKFPYMPVSLILRTRFDSGERASSIKTPLLAIAATDDMTIPARHSKALVNRWGGRKELKMIQNKDHNSMSECDEYWDVIVTYLDKSCK